MSFELYSVTEAGSSVVTEVVTFSDQLIMVTENAEYIKSLQEQLSFTRLAVQRVVMIIVIFFGFAGNALNIAVLTRRWMKSSTNYYLTALAVCDILYLTFALTLTWAHYPSISGTHWYLRYKDLYGRPLADTCSNTGVWLTLTFTVERYIGVCYPMKGKVWCTPQRAKYIILVVSLASAIMTFPEFFEYRIIEQINPVTNSSVIKRQVTEFGDRKSYKFGYYYTNQVMFTFLPLLLLLVFNSLLIRAVMIATRQRRKMTKTSEKPRNHSSSSAYPRSISSGGGGAAVKGEKHQKDQQRITIMLIGVVIVFLVCQTPQAVQKLYMVYLGTHPHLITRSLQLTLIITANYFNLLVTMNCSANFVLYSSFSTKFRMTFRRLFCKCLWCRRSSVYRRPVLDPLLSEVPTTTCNAEVQLYSMNDRGTSYTNIVQVDDHTGHTMNGRRSREGSRSPMICSASTCLDPDKDARRQHPGRHRNEFLSERDAVDNVRGVRKAIEKNKRERQNS